MSNLMGMAEQSAGNSGNGRLVRLRGYEESVSLDTRARFRMPDLLAGALQRELGRAQAHASPAAFERLSLYFVPGTRKRIFLYPAPNIELAVQSFEGPPPGLEPETIRRARDYFYHRMRFVEADKQNRFVIPDGLRQHAGIDEEAQQVTLVAHNYWLALSRSELVEQETQENRAAFEQAATDLLDPAYRAPQASEATATENDRPGTERR
jgi:DNA-binding transcriptional regulator/RsmH inhibitor MraZ